MAFRKKAGVILAKAPDILVVPECEHPDKLLFDVEIKKPSDAVWFGHNKNKGLGIFSYSTFRFKVLDVYNDQFKMVIPLSVSGGDIDFILFAVWANNPADREGQYITQVWKAIHHYKSILSGSHVIFVGDFNSNTIWDKPRREGNHSTVVKLLESKGIYSVYHRHFSQQQGMEAHPTYYLYRHKDKPYHLDYCFVSVKFLDQLQSVEIGDHGFWSAYSDHVPLIATFNKPI